MTENNQHNPGDRLDDMDTAYIMRLIPHRYPFLLVDRLTDVSAFERAVGIKNVTLNEPFFPGHFPSDPIMPGVLIVEAMAQTAAALVVASRGNVDRGDSVYFMGIDNGKFRRPVRPGDQLHLEVIKNRDKMGVWRFDCHATVDGKVVASATVTAKLFGG